MSVWQVKPEDIKRELTYVAPDQTTHKFWVKLKKNLTVGEQRRVMTAGWRGLKRDADTDGATEIQINWQKQTFARTEAYLTDWSLADDSDQKLPLTREAIETLNGDVYALIENAISAHVEAVAEEKKAMSGGSSPSATSD